MTDGKEAEGSVHTSVGSQLIIPIAAILFTIYYFYTIIDAP